MAFGATPKVPEPLPIPARDDPAIAASRERLRLSEGRRKGRRGTILAGRRPDELGEAPVTRPEARGGQLLGA